MHFEVKQFLKEVRRKFPYKFRNKKVLECGSQNINGSPRKYFWFCDYVGIDIYHGPGVDAMIPAHLYEKPDYFETVVSTEMLEHDENWKNSLKQMYANLQEGGLMIITCAGPHRPEHGTRRTEAELSPGTNDYYRNISIEDFESVLPHTFFNPYVLQYGSGKNDLQFYGIKRRHPNITSKEIYEALKKTG